MSTKQRFNPSKKTSTQRLGVKSKVSSPSTSGLLSNLKSEPSSEDFTAISRSLLTPYSPSPSDTHQIPQFARVGWSTVFLPTLYHILSCSSNPWKDFIRGPGIEKKVQSVLDIVYPGNTYKVKWGDKLCQTVRCLIPSTYKFSRTNSCH